MPSITYWNRLEPRTRSTDLSGALAARVRDPAWFLARQWQFGEFAGEDAATPAYVRIQARITQMTAWGLPGQAVQPIGSDVPVERPTTSEPFTRDDLALAVELAQTFDRLLHALSADDLRPHFLAAYPIAAAAPGDDPRAARLRTVWRGRAYDGVAIVVAAVPTATAAVPAAVPGPRRAAAETAVSQLVAWVAELFGTLGPEDPAGWRPDRLDYALRVYAAAGAGGGTSSHQVTLAAEPDREGDLEWFAFDQESGAFPSGVPTPAFQEIRRAVIPGPVKFRGAPNERFWDFEDGRVDFGGLRPDRRDLASMILMDFMLVHGNDWFLVPFEQPVGSLCRVSLSVVDVFGGVTTVPRADAVPAPPAQRWTMFSTSSASGSPADFFLLPASAAASIQDGPAVEDVRFLRDETANLVWAVEHATEGKLGRPWLGHERAGVPPPPPATSELARLCYRLQTHVPSHWIPFQPVALQPLSSGQIALERASLLSDDSAPVLPQPLGKVLQPRAVPPGTPYRVREEEIPREGRRVARVVRRSRGVDGRTHLWVARRRGIGTGEGWSGLRYDAAEPVEPPPEE
ncbi:MAG: hypothetical protein KIT31_03855 [Deltaproteobacteria bacterium]|nr:hypothetical protein [Deltaproteobacteria bacterium]